MKQPRQPAPQHSRDPCCLFDRLLSSYFFGFLIVIGYLRRKAPRTSVGRRLGVEARWISGKKSWAADLFPSINQHHSSAFSSCCLAPLRGIALRAFMLRLRAGGAPQSPCRCTTPLRPGTLNVNSVFRRDRNAPSSTPPNAPPWTKKHSAQPPNSAESPHSLLPIYALDS